MPDIWEIVNVVQQGKLKLNDWAKLLVSARSELQDHGFISLVNYR